MDTRKADILSFLVEEYIKSAEPVGSSFLTKRYRLDWSPATIRNELFELTQEGFLEQPHASAGRVPSNNGWRFYVNHVVTPIPVRRMAMPQMESLDDVAEELSSRSGLFCACVSERGTVVTDGVLQLFSQPDFESRTQFENLARVIEQLQDNAKKIFSDFDEDGAEILIGSENRAFDNDDMSYIYGGVHAKHYGDALVVLMGPKRMQYQKNRDLVQNLINIMSK